MKPIHIIGPAILIVLGFLLWMNLTPGSFRECACEAKYLTEQQERQQCAIEERVRERTGVCYEKSIDGLLIFLSYFDLSK